jgi:hypothetical protein
VGGTDQVAARSRARICGRWPAGIAGSKCSKIKKNPAGGVDVSLLYFYR